MFANRPWRQSYGGHLSLKFGVQRRFYRLCCSAVSERGGQSSCMSFRWIWPAFASRPLRVLPRSENFSWYSLLVLNQPFEIAQILLESPRQIGRIEDRTDLQRYF